MVATKERLPSRGDTVTLRAAEKRKSHSGEEIDPLIYEVEVLVTTVYQDESFVIGVELSRFCYVKGYKSKGKKLPVENPYGSPKTNGYQIGFWEVATES